MNLRPVSLEMSFFQSHSVTGAQAREDTGEGFYEINRMGERRQGVVISNGLIIRICPGIKTG